MDEPMVLIARHTEPVLNDHMLFHAVSELSAVIGSFTTSRGEEDTVFYWCDECDDLVAQLSRHGVFIFDQDIPKHKRNQIAGACHFCGIPLFVEDDLIGMMEAELEEQAKAESTDAVAETQDNSIISLDKYRE
jgi:hypothetical protein